MEETTILSDYRTGSTNLSVSQNSNHSTVLLDVGQILVYLLLPDRILPLLRILRECLLLRLVPVQIKISGHSGISSQAGSEAVLRAHRMLHIPAEPSREGLEGRLQEGEENGYRKEKRRVTGRRKRRLDSPILVKSSPTVFGQVLSKDGLERPQSFRSLDVTHDTEDDHWRCFEDGHSFNNLLLVHLCKRSSVQGLGHEGLTRSRFVDFSNNVGHAGLVADEGGQMDRLGWIIPGECLNLASMSSTPFLGKKPNVSMTRSGELAMRLWKESEGMDQLRVPLFSLQ